MRICVLRSPSCDGDETFSGTTLDKKWSNNQHVFESRIVHPDNAPVNIDAAVSESFDFYINLIHDPINTQSILKACEYFESLKLPSAGNRSWLVEESKEKQKDINANAVKSNRLIQSAGEHHVLVLNLAGYPVPLTPCTIANPRNGVISGHTRWTLISQDKHLNITQKLQKAAVEIFNVGKCHDDFMGIDVCMRMTENNEVLVLEALPISLLLATHRYGQVDVPVEGSLPGGQNALFNIFIANYYLEDSNTQERERQIAITYNRFSAYYDDAIEKSTQLNQVHRDMISKYDFDGRILDAACGTGNFGKLLIEAGKHPTSLVGIDSSPKMVEQCTSTGLYGAVHEDIIQKGLSKLNDDFDHVVCVGVLHFLSNQEFALVMARMFQLARQSVTIMVDEIPAQYNENLVQRNDAHMQSLDHVQEVEDFGVPLGWTVKDRFRRYVWTSPHTGDEIFSNLIRYERHSS